MPLIFQAKSRGKIPHLKMPERMHMQVVYLNWGNLVYCTVCQELHYNAMKQLVSHQGHTKNKGTVEGILRDTVIAQLAVQIVEF